MGISSPGIGSNLDVNGIVTKLMSVEQQPIALLDKKTTSFKATVSGFGTLQSVISQFQSAVSGLANVSKFQGVKTAVGDSTVATAGGSSVALPGSYSLEVSQLAQAQKLNAVGQASTTAAIGAGGSTTLSFDFGTIAGGSVNAATGKYIGATFTSGGSGVKTVTIDGTNNSLAGIRDAVNAANIGVTATIVNDGSNTPYRLSLSVNNTGAANSLKLSVAGDAAISSLLSQDPAANSGQALSETVAAKDAHFKLDGIDVTKSSNTVGDALAGVTLNLTKTNVGAPTTVSVTRDTANVVSSVNAFVVAYNGVTQALKDAQAYDPATKTGAILNGESSVRTIQNQIRSILTAPISGSTSTFTLLSQVGVTIQSTGLLGVDSTKLQAAVDNNFTQIAGLFSNVGSSSDALVTYNAANGKTAAGNYAVNVSQLATKAQTTAGAAANLTITAGVNDTLGVTLDGVTSNITLTPGAYANAGALAAELQSRINGNTAFAGLAAAVTESSGILSIASKTYGSTSVAKINDGNGQTGLGFASGVTTNPGVNVAGTINGVTAVGAGQSLVGAAGDASEGLSIEITGGVTGSRGAINYSKGYAYQFNQLTTSILATDGPIAARTNGINASLKDIADNKAKLSARLVGIEARYRAQFTALDSLIGSMSSTSSFLSQQLANLPKIS
ncbi:MAG: flagellar filament capping protein FliD [Herminiimonas sp.]|nr:flagellar filament capping protein FliD [Herminiimonas sp.]